MRTTRALIALAGLSVAALGLAGCGASPAASGDDEKSIIIGSANFPESEIIANIYALALEDAGYTVTTRMSIGSREAYIPALKDGSIDLIPEYTGNLLRFFDEDSTATAPEDVIAALPGVLAEEELEVFEAAEAEDKNSITVTAETAEEWDLTTIADLVEYNDELIIGSNAEFQTGVGLPALEATYGLVPSEFVVISDGGGPKTVSSLLDGTITAANIFTTSPLLTQNDLVALEDPLSAFAAQNVVPLVSSDKATSELATVLDAVSAELTTEDLLALNEEVSGANKTAPATAATQWLQDKGLIG